MGKKIKMDIGSGEEFDRVFSAIANELVYANVYYDLFRNLNDSFTEYRREVNNSVAFWGITRDSIRDVSFLSLCRVYDPEPNANSLPNLLMIIRDEPDFINKIRIVKEEIENEVLPKASATIDHVQLTNDIKFVTSENDSVKRLIKWRSNIFVHTNSNQISTGRGLDKQHIPQFEDIESLLRDGMTVINRYAGLFRFTEHSTHFGQMDDYKFVLDSVRLNLKLHKEKLDAEYAKYGIEPGTFDTENMPRFE